MNKRKLESEEMEARDKEHPSLQKVCKRNNSADKMFKKAK